MDSTHNGQFEPLRVKPTDDPVIRGLLQSGEQAAQRPLEIQKPPKNPRKMQGVCLRDRNTKVGTNYV